MKIFSTFYKRLIFKGLRQALARGRSILKQKLKSLSITKNFSQKFWSLENRCYYSAVLKRQQQRQRVNEKINEKITIKILI